MALFLVVLLEFAGVLKVLLDVRDERRIASTKFGDISVRRLLWAIKSIAHSRPPNNGMFVRLLFGKGENVIGVIPNPPSAKIFNEKIGDVGLLQSFVHSDSDIFFGQSFRRFGKKIPDG